MEKCKRISFYIPRKTWIDMNLICIHSDKTLSEFIRKAIQEKIKRDKDLQKSV